MPDEHLRLCGDWALAAADPLVTVSPTDWPQAAEPEIRMKIMPWAWPPGEIAEC